MRRWLIAFVLGCGGGEGGGVPPGAAVVDLSDGQQLFLCQDFVAAICSMPELQSFCTDCVKGSGCEDAVAAGAVDGECAPPITAGQVSECGDSGDFEVGSRGGGCMFDALELVCD